MVPLISENFPDWVGDLPPNLEFTKTQLLWSAITVGRPDKQSVRHHGRYSRFEMQYRWNMVQAALDFSSPKGWIRNSPAFQNFDPSEKGAVNFFLGMVFVKLCAAKLLQMPWLVHAKLFRDQNGSIDLKSGRSCADLIGYQPSGDRWGAFEAKGRNSGLNPDLIDTAKAQAQNIDAIEGVDPALRVASCLYRTGASKQLCMFWKDPPGDERREPLKLRSDSETWRQYYLPIDALAQDCQRNPDLFVQRYGFILKVRDEIPKLLSLAREPGRAYREPLEHLWEWSAERGVADEKFWFGDGVGIEIIHEDRLM